jgi:hypothetical protein
MKRKRHTPEQIVKKLGTAGKVHPEPYHPLHPLITGLLAENNAMDGQYRASV